MSTSRRQEMHINSLEAYHSGQEGLFSKREQEVLLAIRAAGKATDREVMVALGYSDMNAVRPRLSELVKDGVLEEAGAITDPVTGKTVRVVRLKADPRLAQRQFQFTEAQQ